jgi:Zn-dependent protease
MPDIQQTVQNIVTLFPAFLLSLVVHEFAHAWMAKMFGDSTSEWSGRLTLNPVVHMDPLGTVVFPLISIVFGGIFFGWARPVPIDTRQFRDYRSGLFWVSFAGPLSNILLGFLSAVVLVGFVKFVPESSPVYGFFHAFLQSLLIWNFSLAIFNLLPIPPLDGSNMVLSFLNYNAAQKFVAIQQFSFFLILFLAFSGAFRILAYPIYFLREVSLAIASMFFGFA